MFLILIAIINRTCEFAFYNTAIKSEFDEENSSWNKIWTFGELLRDVRYVAKGLIALGVKPATVICIVVEDNCAETSIATVGIIYAGAVACAVDDDNDDETMLQFLSDTKY